MEASDKTTASAKSAHTPSTGNSPREPASGAEAPQVETQPAESGLSRRTARVRHASEWGRQKYTGSLAEYFWRRLDSVDVVNRGLLFAATLLLCFFPLLIVADALAGRSTLHTIFRHVGLSTQAATDVSHLFAPSTTTASSFVGSASIVFVLAGGIAAATALQELYEHVFEVPNRGMKDIPRRLLWLVWLAGFSALAGWAGPPINRTLGPVVLVVVALAVSTIFWLGTMWILLARRVPWRRLIPAACATSIFYLGMEGVFSIFFSSTVTSDYDRYGPIGIVFAIMTYLISLGVVVILGAVVGVVWHERELSLSGAFRKLRRTR